MAKLPHYKIENILYYYYYNNNNEEGEGKEEEIKLKWSFKSYLSKKP